MSCCDEEEPLGCLTVMVLTFVWFLFTCILAGIIQESTGVNDDRCAWYALWSEAAVMGILFVLNRAFGRKRRKK